MNENTKLTHGLLTIDFKEHLYNLIFNHKLDIQTKALVVEMISANLNSLSQEQTQKELKEYQLSLQENQTENTDTNKQKDEIQEV